MDFTAAKSQIKLAEGRRLSAYPDSEGYLTIGYGRLIDSRIGGGISADEAELLFENDFQRVIDDLGSHLPWWRNLSDTRKAALLDACYNLGITKLLGFKKALTALEAGDYATASREFLDSRWATQVGRRARIIADQIKYG